MRAIAALYFRINNKEHAQYTWFLPTSSKKENAFIIHILTQALIKTDHTASLEYFNIKE